MATIDTIKDILVENLDIDRNLITEESTFDSLNIDSLDLVQLICDLEEKFRENPDVGEDEIIEMVRVCTGLETADDMFGSDAYKRYLIGVTAFGLHSKLTGKGV